MQEDKQELSEEQKQSKREAQESAEILAGFITTPAFALQKDYLENKIKAFVNEIFTQEDEPLDKFEGQRKEIMGLRRMFGEIEFQVNQLINDKQNTRTS